MPYAITALADGQTFKQTRVQRSSAIVLARKWIAKGLQRVEIEDAGKRYSVDAFQKRFFFEGGRYRDAANAGLPIRRF